MGFQVIVHLWWVILMFAVRGVVVAKVSAAGHECRSTSCSHDGPEIRFPFWIKDKQPDHCGYPGFQVFCDTGKTLLHFEYLANTSLQRTQIIHPYNVSVLGINYATQEIQVDILITNNLKLVSTSTSLPPPLFRKIRHPYYDQNYDGPNTSFFNCSSRAQDSISVMLTSAGGETFPVDCLVDSYPTSFRILNCIKVFNSSLPFYLLEDIEEYYYIDWSIPDCRECEAKGEYCKLMDNITSRSNTTTCVPKGHRWTSIKPVAVIIPVAILIALSLVVLLYFIIKSYRQRKYDQLKIEIPSMKHAIHMLESEECPKMPPNPFKSSNIRSFENELEAIDESE
ncbi:hypothetical protein POM88_031571 [Heracleum sosnowskyi]|uniref:RING-type E3 ubiquitin transferase n=1 Tax=Heracleum sosnowskyi TaxID=360622 RepID=A0AAD8MKH6_9APIA|nr:hypothetical protein POM88_031571 [Heracleum sosnowskyi]